MEEKVKKNEDKPSIKPEDLSIHEQLSLIQTEVSAPKDKTGEGVRFNFRDAEGILKATKPCLVKYKCHIVTKNVEVLHIGERYYIKTESFIVNKKGESISAIGLAQETESKTRMDSAQYTGSCTSYARKYSLCNLLAIDSSDDNDVLASKLKGTVGEAIEALRMCSTIEELADCFAENKIYQKDVEFIKAKDEMKVRIAKVQKEGKE